MAADAPVFEIYRDDGQQPHTEWRWRLKARNGQIVASSGEGFRDKTDAQRAAHDARDAAADAAIHIIG